MCVRTYAGDPEGDRSVDASGLYQLGLPDSVRTCQIRANPPQF